MKDFDLRKYLSENKLLKEEHPDHTHGLTIKGRGFDWRKPSKKEKELEYTEFVDDGENQYMDLDYNKIRAYISAKKGPDFADDFIDGYNDDFYENVVRFLDKIESPTDEEVLNFVDIEIEKR
jgi:hypothetical protein